MGEVDLLAVARRWWWALVLGTLISAGAGYLVASHAPRTYEAKADLLVGPVNSDVSLDASGALARTYAQLATSRSLLADALDRANVRMSTQELADSVSTTSNSITRIVSITVSDRSAKRAAKLANAIAARLRVEANRDPPQSTASLDAYSSDPAIAGLTSDLRDPIIQAARRVFGASTAGRLKVLDDADVPRTASSPAIGFITVASGLAGLVIALLLGMAAEARANRRVDEDRLLGLDTGFLGSVQLPRIRRGQLALVEPGTRTVDDAYRVLAGHLESGRPEGRARTLLLVDTADGAVAAAVGIQLAQALAGSERHVLLADMNSSGTGVSTLMGVDDRPGFGELIAALSGSGRTLQPLELGQGVSENLTVLPAGAPTEWFLPGTLLASALDSLKRSADLVILAGPPLFRSATGMVCAGLADRTVLVVDGDHASREDTDRAVSELSRSDGHFVGTLLARHTGSLPFAKSPGRERRQAS